MALIKNCEKPTSTVISKSNGLFYVAFESGVIIEACIKTSEITKIMIGKSAGITSLELANEG